ncbi:MAG: TOMM precursor leader peptide-binding protein [Candidatus Cybelea sp.]|jgi:bacteriocin biosynthesis cyclodehydratase domain-containing protein
MPDERVVALPVQLIEVPDGVIVKRGVDELLVSIQSAAAIAGALARAGAPGGVLVAELPEIIHRAAAEADADALIAELRRKRMLVDPADASPDAESPEEILAWNTGRSPKAARAAFERVSINVLGVNAISRQLAASLAPIGARLRVVDDPNFRNVRFFENGERLLLERWGLAPPEAYDAWESSPPDASMVCLVVCSDFGGLQRLAGWNALAYRRGWHFLPVVLQNAVGLVGPLVIPKETACFQCLLSREEANSPTVAVKRATEMFAFEGQLVAAYHPSMATALGDVAAVELTKHYAYGWPSAAIGNAIEVNLLAATMQPRPILKAPHCAVCSPLRMRTRVDFSRESIERK